MQQHVQRVKQDRKKSEDEEERKDWETNVRKVQPGKKKKKIKRSRWEQASVELCVEC